MYRGAAQHGADGEAEGDEVDDQGGGQHRGGAGHGELVIGGAAVSGDGPARLLVGPGISDGEARPVAGALASWVGSGS